MAETLVSGARLRLAAVTEVTDVLGSGQGWDTWIFQDKPYVVVEGTGAVAVVLRHAGTWMVANQHNTARFPKLCVEIFGDPDRNAGGHVEAENAAEKIMDAWAPIDRVLHRPQGGTEDWGALRVTASTRLEEPAPLPAPDEFQKMADGLMVAWAYYGVVIA